MPKPLLRRSIRLISRGASSSVHVLRRYLPTYLLLAVYLPTYLLLAVYLPAYLLLAVYLRANHYLLRISYYSLLNTHY